MMQFACVAILIKTPIGILQMRRLLRGWGTPADVFPTRRRRSFGFCATPSRRRRRQSGWPFVYSVAASKRR